MDDLKAKLEQALPQDGSSFCVECGPNVTIDEDGCCVACGAGALGEAVTALSNLRVIISAHVERLERERDKAQDAQQILTNRSGELLDRSEQAERERAALQSRHDATVVWVKESHKAAQQNAERDPERRGFYLGEAFAYRAVLSRLTGGEPVGIKPDPPRAE